MAIANPRIHIICGICGNKDMLEYEVKSDICDDTSEELIDVMIRCNNCCSITYLDDVIKSKNRTVLKGSLDTSMTWDRYNTIKVLKSDQ